MNRNISSLGEVAWRPKTRQGSGQGLLLILLGDFVWGKQEAVWTSDLVAGLAELGVSENAARKAIHRAAKKNIIELHRHGRQARCVIGEAGKQIFREGILRVYGFKGESPDWDGRWLVVTVTVPETQRNSRHFLKTRFRWTGMGSPTPGVWITPRISSEAGAIIDKLKLENDTFSYIGTFGPVGSESSMVKAAWDIKGLEQLYKEFIDQFKNMRPKSGSDIFCAYVNLVHAWRQFPYIDPQLPRQFLPDPWIGRRAADVLHEKREQWSAAAIGFWGDIQSKNRG